MTDKTTRCDSLGAYTRHEPTDAEAQAYLAAFSEDLPPDTAWTPDTIARVKRGLSAARWAQEPTYADAYESHIEWMRHSPLVVKAGVIRCSCGVPGHWGTYEGHNQHALWHALSAAGAQATLEQLVRELHATDADGNCGHCTRGRVYPVPAPCETVCALAGGGEGR